MSSAAKLQTVHLHRPGIRVGEYDLDAVAIEYDPDTNRFDFRLELGSGLGIYWALPAGPNDRLRLFHVDGAAYTVDEPELIEDPFVCDLDLEWTGTLAEIEKLDTEEDLVSVRIRATSNPATYRCEIGTYWRKAEMFWEPRDLQSQVVLQWRK